MALGDPWDVSMFSSMDSSASLSKSRRVRLVFVISSWFVWSVILVGFMEFSAFIGFYGIVLG